MYDENMGEETLRDKEIVKGRHAGIALLCYRVLTGRTTTEAEEEAMAILHCMSRHWRVMWKIFFSLLQLQSIV